MPEYNKDLSGALFQNDKGDNPARPDYRGRCQIDGKKYRISGWKRRAKASNQPYMSLAFTLDDSPDDPTESDGAEDAQASMTPDDEHPF